MLQYKYHRTKQPCATVKTTNVRPKTSFKK